MKETLFSGLVEQVTDDGQVVTLQKDVFTLQGDAPLAVVRKRRPEGATRPPVVLVHGFAQNRYSWHSSIRSMSAWLADRGWDVWNLELRGHGRSRPERGSEAERVLFERSRAEAFTDYVDDIARTAAALPEPGFWMGHSLGGSAIYAAAARLRDDPQLRPRGVVGIGAIYGFGRQNKAMRLLTHASHALRDSPLLQPVHVRTRLVGRLLARLYGITDIAGYAFPISGWWPGSVEPELLAERLERGFDWTSMDVWLEMSRWSVQGVVDFDSDWHRTDVPLLVTVGDKDHLLPPADGKLAYARSGSTDRTFKVFDDWHDEVHWGHLDLVLGRYARRHVWRTVDEWMEARAR